MEENLRVWNYKQTYTQWTPLPWLTSPKNSKLTKKGHSEQKITWLDFVTKTNWVVFVNTRLTSVQTHRIFFLRSYAESIFDIFDFWDIPKKNPGIWPKILLHTPIGARARIKNDCISHLLSRRRPLILFSSKLSGALNERKVEKKMRAVKFSRALK